MIISEMKTKRDPKRLNNLVITQIESTAAEIQTVRSKLLTVDQP